MGFAEVGEEGGLVGFVEGRWEGGFMEVAGAAVED